MTLLTSTQFFSFLGAAMLIAIRPERLKLTKPGAAPTDASAWPATVTRLIYLGGRTEIHLRLQDGSPAVSYVVNEGGIPWVEGDTVAAWFRPADAWLLPAAVHPPISDCPDHQG